MLLLCFVLVSLYKIQSSVNNMQQPKFIDRRSLQPTAFPAGTYLFKVNNENTTAMLEICSESTIEKPDQHH